MFSLFTIKKISYWAVGVFVAGLLLWPLLLSSTHMRLGSIFFGEIPQLYNLNLAQHFYIFATNPLWGQAPPWAHYQLSRTYFIQGQFGLSLSEAFQELKKYPEHNRTYYILGLTYGYMNKEQYAIDSFSKFIDQNPTSWAARNDKAWLQFRIGDVAGGLETIEPVSSLLNPWVQNTYGTLLMNVGRTEDAEEAFERAQSLASGYSGDAWGGAYPGNDPRVYDSGLQAMQESIKTNLDILRNKAE